ncbi:hypothetical protein AB0L97_17130 [Nocardia sp. NPDC051911]
MPKPRRDLLRWQFDPTWSLAGIHLADITEIGHLRMLRAASLA